MDRKQLFSPAKPLQPDIKVGFILLNHFTLISVAGLVESLRFAADASFSSQQIFCQWELMTWNNQPVTASCGMRMTPTTDLDLDRPWDYVVLAGGLLEETRSPPAELVQLVQQLHARGITLITLCSGVFVAGHAGLLNGVRCAIHFTTRDEFRQRFPEAIPVIDQTYIADGGIISSPGGTTIDLAIDLIRRHCGTARADKVRQYLLAPDEKTKKPRAKKVSVAPAPPAYQNGLVSAAVEYMQQHLDSPAPLNDITAFLAVSPRQLNQAFIKHTGDTAVVYWRNLRLEQARKLMANSDLSVTEIANACGFADASHLIAWFRKQYGETPASFRRRRRETERLM